MISSAAAGVPAETYEKPRRKETETNPRGYKKQRQIVIKKKIH